MAGASIIMYRGSNPIIRFYRTFPEHEGSESEGFAVSIHYSLLRYEASYGLCSNREPEYLESARESVPVYVAIRQKSRRRALAHDFSASEKNEIGHEPSSIEMPINRLLKTFFKKLPLDLYASYRNTSI